MKKSIALFIVVMTIATFSLLAQEKDSKSKLIEGIKKEKLRKPIKLESVKDAEKKNEPIQKNTRATDLKVSNVVSGNEEGEAQICIDPSNPNKMVMSFMNNTAAGNIEYPVYYSSNGGSSSRHNY